jgi:hypothetical protein
LEKAAVFQELSLNCEAQGNDPHRSEAAQTDATPEQHKPRSTVACQTVLVRRKQIDRHTRTELLNDSLNLSPGCHMGRIVFAWECTLLFRRPNMMPTSRLRPICPSPQRLPAETGTAGLRLLYHNSTFIYGNGLNEKLADNKRSILDCYRGVVISWHGSLLV